jgi:hypothetical protein
VTLNDILAFFKENYTVTMEVHNKNGYETTYKLDLTKDGPILAPKYKEAKVVNIESPGKDKINIVVYVDEE